MNPLPPSWRRLGELTAQAVGRRQGALLLHVTDIHNRLRGFRFSAALTDALAPDLVVNTGDLSGAPGPVEAALLRTAYRIRRPQVFAPGNHDSATTVRVMRGMGAEVLDRPRLVTVAGVRIWGYPDPNASPWGAPPYDSRLCRATAEIVRPPTGEWPYVIAVHSSHMVRRPPPEVSLVLWGHRHDPGVDLRGRTLFVRPGSTGGGGPFGGPLQAAVVDLGLPEHRPLGVWLVETDGRTVAVRRVPLQADRAAAPAP
ncbi:MAG: metallophosphoesterase family protein [Actinomycetota bacterium]